PPGALPRLPDANAALAWFRSEESTIRALIDATAGGSEQERSSQLALTYDSLSTMAGRPTDRTSLAAQHTGHRALHVGGASESLHEADQHSDSALSPDQQPRPDDGTSPETGASRIGLVSAQ
ncbi:hypothetical protein, partial [Streptomyces sp. BK340]|uniref:hypothetical protein n=1 Tax=Streptomyces sp. BK340 TaxID=2572903 RepID=UPI0011ACA008